MGEWSETLSFFTCESTKITPKAIGDTFGISVSVSDNGNTFIIGAHSDDDMGANAGAAYIYRWDGSDWVETKIVASDGAAVVRFGHDVGLSGDGYTIVVSAIVDDDMGTDSGSAYIYRWDGSSWVETKIVASDGSADDGFGSLLSMTDDGSEIVVGVGADDDNGTNSGSVYIYRWDGSSWVKSKILASDGKAGDRFGRDVGISGDGSRLVAGAYLSDAMGIDSGAAYIY